MPVGGEEASAGAVAALDQLVEPGIPIRPTEATSGTSDLPAMRRGVKVGLGEDPVSEPGRKICDPDQQPKMLGIATVGHGTGPIAHALARGLCTTGPVVAHRPSFISRGSA